MMAQALVAFSGCAAFVAKSDGAERRHRSIGAGGHAVAQTPLALALPGAGSRLSTQQRANRAMQSLSRRYSMEFGDVKAVIERWNSKKSTLCNCPQKVERKAGSKAGRKVHKPGCLHKKYMEMQSEYKEQLRDS